MCRMDIGTAISEVDQELRNLKQDKRLLYDALGKTMDKVLT